MVHYREGFFVYYSVLYIGGQKRLPTLHKIYQVRPVTYNGYIIVLEKDRRHVQ